MKKKILLHAKKLGVKLEIVEGTFLNEFSESPTMFKTEEFKTVLTETGILNFFKFRLNSPLN